MQNPVDEPIRTLHQFLQKDIEPLQGIISSYVIRAGLARGEAVQSVTLDVLSEATLQALAHIDLFVTILQPRAWFLGIAANVIKRRRATLFKQNQRELSIGSLAATSENGSESDFFDRLSLLTYPGPEQEVETRAQVAELLSLASSDDRRVLRLAVLQDLNTNQLALALNVQPGAARVRLHRALNRLRVAWLKHIQDEQKRGSHV
ncbi:MAG TPA: RNA polymerase sigma factor [Ktedonobacteraceae bacterium]